MKLDPKTQILCEQVALARYALQPAEDQHELLACGIRAEFFFNPQLQQAWELATAKILDGKPVGHIDLGLTGGDLQAVLVAQSSLEDGDVIVGDVVSALRDSWRARQLEHITALVVDRGGFERALLEIDAIMGEGDTSVRTYADVAAPEIKDYYQRAVVGGVADRSIPMPIEKLHKQLGGWPLGKTVYLVGPSSNHKTTLLRQSWSHAAASGVPALLVLLEDTAEDIVARTVAASTKEVSPKQFLRRDAHPRSAIESARKVAMLQHGNNWGTLGTLGMIYDEPGATVEAIQLAIRKCNPRPKLVCVDYFQLIERDDPHETDHDHTKRVTKRFQRIARDLDCCILCSANLTAQALRDYKKDGKAPSSTDALGGGVMFANSFGMLTCHIPNGPDRFFRLTAEKWKNDVVGWSESFPVDAKHDLIAPYGLRHEGVAFGERETEQ